MEEQLANGLNKLAFLFKGAGRGPCVPPRIDIFAVSFQSSGSGHSQRTLEGSGDKAVSSRSWFKVATLALPPRPVDRDHFSSSWLGLLEALLQLPETGNRHKRVSGRLL